MVQTALDLDPLSPIINGTYGIMLEFMGRREEGRAAYSRILDIAPGFSLAHYYLGVSDLSLGRLDEAIRRYRTAATLDPQSSNHLLAAAMGYVNLGDIERAKALFGRAASLNGNRSTAELYEEFTSLVLNRENPVRLIAVIEAMPFVTLRWIGDPTFYRNAILQTGDLAALRRFLERHYRDLLTSYESAVHSTNYWAAVDLAWLLRMEGDAERADRLLDASLAVLRQTPSGRFGYRGLTDAKILALQSDEAGALAALRAAFDAGWRHLWWMAENDPTLASISDHPEFIAIFDEIRADVATQLKQVREMERNGEISSWPGLAVAE
jgi:tetratricopeptide (TPR) repeat protein